MAANNDIKDFELKLDDGRVLRFVGKLLGEADDLWDVGVKGKYKKTFWNKYSLYKTINDNFILYHASCIKEEYKEEEYQDFPDLQKLIDYVKKQNKRVLYMLLKNADIPLVIDID